MEDSKIIDLYFARSEEAITQTKIKYEPYCASIAYNILTSREDCEECLSDTWLSAWNAIPPRCPQVLAAFLGKLTRNHALDRYRYRTAGKRRDDRITAAIDELSQCISAPENVEEEVIDRQDLQRVLNSFLGELAPEARIMFLQRYWYFLSVKEIAAQHGCSRSKVKMSLLRTRGLLRQRLIREGYEI